MCRARLQQLDARLICAALWEAGADVTLIQRSSTHIAPSDSLMELALGGLYSEAAGNAGVTTDKADLIFGSVPYKNIGADAGAGL